jgi:succinate-semialdehyde dehydrogenase / glutarate-semialdehyde dehydrogenase
MYPDTQLLIDGRWADAADARHLDVRNPATGQVIGKVAHAGIADLDRALAAAERGFAEWSARSAFDRAAILRQAAALLRERSGDVARLMTLEQGKPLAEARMEIGRGAEVIDWLAGEAQRVYDRVIPARAPNVTQTAVKQPVGPVAGFAPWNFPVNQIVRKMAGALAAGCSIIVKGAEETPASGAALVACFVDAGVPAGAIALVFGTPAEISEHLIASPVIRKVSFTGSTVVGREIAALAARQLKIVTLELGGHAPVLVFADCDVAKAAREIALIKYRNAGQTCLSPTRILVERSAYPAFVEAFVAAARPIRLGDGLDPDTQMGPMANPRRVAAMQRLVDDARARGATVALGGDAPDRPGYFYNPTVLTDVPGDALAMNEEPFGPLALIHPFDGLEDAIAEANRLPYGLSTYVFTGSSLTARACSRRIESGMVAVNGFGLGHPETPFGGMKDSGQGQEGGSEAIEAFLLTRFVTVTDL